MATGLNRRLIDNIEIHKNDEIFRTRIECTYNQTRKHANKMSYQYVIYESHVFSPVAYVTAVTFPTSRFGKHTHTLTFDEPLTETAALVAAQKYLGKPLTKRYFDAVKDDIYVGNGLTFKEFRSQFAEIATRGELIESLCCLSHIKHVDEYGTIELCLDS